MGKSKWIESKSRLKNDEKLVFCKAEFNKLEEVGLISRTCSQNVNTSCVDIGRV